MGSVYRRKDSPNWWIAYLDATGARRMQSAETNSEEIARERLDAIERQIAAQKLLAMKTPGPVTVSQWMERWSDGRIGKIASADDVRRVLRNHMVPLIGNMPLRDVRPRDIQAVIDAATERGLSSRTVNGLHGLMRTMFRTAVKKDLISTSPCILSVRDGDLPKPRDSDPEWRSGAVFDGSEAAALIYDVRLLLHHRVLWALLFFGAMRIGEAVARRWSDIERATPLDKMHVRNSYNVKSRRFRAGGKSGIHREVPVLPQLAEILADWRANGRAEYVAKLDRPWRQKQPVEDFIVPGPRGGVLSGNTSWRWLKDDLELLGLRERRQHDTRRTFVSLAAGAGARPDIVDLVVWGLDPTVRNRYLTMPWPVVCAEISKLHIPKPSESPATHSYAGS